MMPRFRFHSLLAAPIVMSKVPRLAAQYASAFSTSLPVRASTSIHAPFAALTREMSELAMVREKSRS